ncbi:MAG: ABC transporter permease [Firmicutes bacterium]|nr:ABC transporter permease [Bacillota bacterium]MCL5065810.1 ABC transporter permease [Bacillota bacterium]
MRYILDRLGFLLISAWAAVTINFILPRLMPGNPALLMVDRYQGELGPRALAAIKLQFGITSQPMLTQYWHYLGNLLQGHLGISLTYYPVSVSHIIATSLPWTLGLAGTATVIAAILGTLLGIFAAWKRNLRTDSILTTGTTFTGAIPHQYLGLLLLLILSYHFHWFPVAHSYSASMTPQWTFPFAETVVYHSLLPAVTIVVPGLGGWLLHMRNNMIQTLGDDYIVFAQAKGVSPRGVMLRHAARNALLPSVTNFAMAIGFVVGGVLLVEVVFSYPGVGYQLFTAVQNEDYPLMQGLFLIISLSVLVLNFLVDLLYGLIDPRARRTGVA